MAGRTLPFHVVIVGAGFGGLECTRQLSRRGVRVTLIDENNYHLFTPLLYQVASSLLNAGDIAQATRAILRGREPAKFLQARVSGFDFEAREVLTADGPAVPFDALVIAAGSTTNFFGVEGAEACSFGLKDLPEALELRNQVLLSIERAAADPDEESRKRELSFVVVGGGPTGVEYAGALSELLKVTVPSEYAVRERPKITLVEMQSRVLSTFPDSLSASAGKELRRRGIDLRMNTRVQSIDANGIVTTDGERIEAKTVVWAAGVRPRSLASASSLPTTRGGRIEVDEHLAVPGQTGVYAIGDIAAVQHKGKVLPMLSSPAVQEGSYLGKHLGKPIELWKPFRYRDRGIMATIGKNEAVAAIGPLKFKGFIGWILWLTVHLYLLVGFRNRFLVFLGWAWNYLRMDRPVRIITRARERPGRT